MEEHCRFYVRDAGLKKGNISNLASHGNVTDYGEAGGWESRRFEKSNRNLNSLYFSLV